MLHVGALRWIQLETSGTRGSGRRRVLNASRKRLSSRADQWLTGVGVCKDPTRTISFAYGPAGEAKEPPPGQWELSLRRLRVDICRRVDLTIQLFSLNPKREHFEPLVLISRHEYFSLIGPSILATFVVSSPLFPFLFLLGSFVRLVRYS